MAHFMISDKDYDELLDERDKLRGLVAEYQAMLVEADLLILDLREDARTR